MRYITYRCLWVQLPVRPAGNGAGGRGPGAVAGAARTARPRVALTF